MGKVHHIESHYDSVGDGATLVFYRPIVGGYIGHHYKYTFTRFMRMILVTNPPKWSTRFFKNIQLVERVS